MRSGFVTFKPRVSSDALKHYRYAYEDGRLRTLHRARAERAIGKPLPAKAVVHHVEADGYRDDSRLVICENQKYHFLLHCRADVIAAGGDPNTQQMCHSCNTPKRQNEFSASGWAHRGQCRACNTSQAKRRRQ